MKRMIAAALAAVLVATSAPAVSNAQGVVVKEVIASNISVQDPSTQQDFENGKVIEITDSSVTESVKDTENGVVVTAVKSSNKKVKLSGTVNNKKITEISSSAFKNCKKAETIDLTDVELTTLKKNQFKGASKAKTIKINAKNLTAKKINAKALKGCKAKKIVLTCKSKSAYNKLVKQLKKSAPKGTKFSFKKAK
ncbi:leucine-rich repeat protein [Butyrivibrio sp. MB2005]|uniref:leucine-rich repeat protein n=1 Tax=Butyrivibrio sp. MB2005 TaxID=1280678 RepID=UPI0004177ADD|nr:leucine-rich repeat protein [Butyrivibrio sp. MB2005]